MIDLKEMSVFCAHKMRSILIKCNTNWVFFCYFFRFVLLCFVLLCLLAWYKIEIVARFSAKDATPCASTSARGHIQVNDQRTSYTSNCSTLTIDQIFRVTFEQLVYNMLALCSMLANHINLVIIRSHCFCSSICILAIFSTFILL